MAECQFSRTRWLKVTQLLTGSIPTSVARNQPHGDLD